MQASMSKYFKELKMDLVEGQLISSNRKAVMWMHHPAFNVDIALYERMSKWHQFWFHLLLGVTFTDAK